jgi:hypothetical protein
LITSQNWWKRRKEKKRKEKTLVEMFGIDGWMNWMNDGLLLFRSNDFFIMNKSWFFERMKLSWMDGLDDIKKMSTIYFGI